MAYPQLRAEQIVFWEMYAAGLTIEVSSQRVGHSLGWGRRLVLKAWRRAPRVHAVTAAGVALPVDPRAGGDPGWHGTR